MPDRLGRQGEARQDPFQTVLRMAGGRDRQVAIDGRKARLADMSVEPRQDQRAFGQVRHHMHQVERRRRGGGRAGKDHRALRLAREKPRRLRAQPDVFGGGLAGDAALL